MADSTPTPEAGAEGAPQEGVPQEGVPQVSEQPLQVNAQYVKDLSFEAPSAPTIFTLMQTGKPDISVNIDVQADPLQENIFEIVLEIRGECKIGDSVAFVVELAYGGVFTLNVPEEHRQPVLLIECPRLIFPFARAILADITRDAGFPPLMLGPVDFVAMYRNTLERMAAEKQA
ncbi:MAG: protein-export chaperone SecB [Rhodospirillales bacterium]